MEANHKRRGGFIKALPFTLVPNKPNNKVIKPTRKPYSSASSGLLDNFPQVDYGCTDEDCDDDYFLAGDEAVDTKAATYISNVQQRFKLEFDSDGRKLQHVHY
ncbi:hypothetical protein Scep_020964 [Stephania cephalantha]|uniref:Uncharacterized protein n=1 Tax=Stephania cephalantha TaxID=152367 RepID=A0AAP0F576_9MAGN